jgi:hypothetical protein
MLNARIALALGTLLIAGPALAQQQVDAPRLSCQALASTVAQQGSVIATTGPHMFERVVRDQGFCSQAETTAPVWVPTSDVAQCSAGYRCKDKFNEGSGRD